MGNDDEKYMHVTIKIKAFVLKVRLDYNWLMFRNIFCCSPSQGLIGTSTGAAQYVLMVLFKYDKSVES